MGIGAFMKSCRQFADFRASHKDFKALTTEWHKATGAEAARRKEAKAARFAVALADERSMRETAAAAPAPASGPGFSFAGAGGADAASTGARPDGSLPFESVRFVRNVACGIEERETHRPKLQSYIEALSPFQAFCLHKGMVKMFGGTEPARGSDEAVEEAVAYCETMTDDNIDTMLETLSTHPIGDLPLYDGREHDAAGILGALFGARGK